MDSTRSDTQRIRNLLSTKKLTAKSIVQISDVVSGQDADIEDLFAPSFYVSLVNAAYAKELDTPIKVADVTKGNPRIVKRVEAHFAANGVGRFNHYRPATHFLTHQGTLNKKLNDATLDRAEQLAKTVNALLS